MIRIHRATFLAGVLVLAAAGVGAWVAQQGGGDLPALPEQPTGVRGIVYAQPFRLDQAYTHVWRVEQPQVRAGYLLVLEVDPELVRPRQTAMNVLYVGDQTAERINYGYPSGRLVVLVPCASDATGAPVLDLASTPIWFGAPALPEEVDAAQIAAELRRARDGGIRPFGAAQVQQALAQGGAPFTGRDRTDLERWAAQLVLALVPEEHELAESLLAPLVGR